MKKEYIINDKTFSSKKSLLNYFKDKKDTFSDTTYLKKIDSEFYNDFITLCKHHNEYDIKFKNMKDIIIQKNWNKQNAFYILYEDDSVIDISYRWAINCINKSAEELKKEDYNLTLNSALRTAVLPERMEFWNNNLNRICEFCKTDENIEVDHINEFKKIKDEFLKNNTPPLSFTEDPIKNYSCFKDCDQEFELKWVEYHKKHNHFRYLCANCNKGRNRKKI